MKFRFRKRFEITLLAELLLAFQAEICVVHLVNNFLHNSGLFLMSNCAAACSLFVIFTVFILPIKIETGNLMVTNFVAEEN